MKEKYIEQIYAGWLAKIIGIRLGAPIEGWTYEKIANVYGELTDYPVNYQDFAADDDSNGPIFFLRGLEDGGRGADMTAQDVADALLNYAPFEHGFFWWGGYGVSTEHTAYLNLRAGVPAPRSGSIEQNGHMIAEQIGGQIFIDSWGLVAPGNPDLAATLAEKAASVTHGGNGVYGGIFWAACISYAFECSDIRAIIEKGLSYIPADCEYTRVVNALLDYYDNRESDQWRDCFKYIFDNFGYDKYPGNCHIIPNIAVMIMAMLYGKGDFDDTLNICNMGGWDTDCNVGNIGALMGIICGLESINYSKWRKPINDFLANSSVVGSLNIMDIPFGALYIAKLAYALAGEELPGIWNELAQSRIDSCHFEYPGSTHAIRVRSGSSDPHTVQELEYELSNTAESAYTGSRSLKVMAKPLRPADRLFIYKKTYYYPEDFHDSRYDPCFSPLVYPGQTIRAAACIPEYGEECDARMYVRDARSGELVLGEKVRLKKNEWAELRLSVPRMEAALLDEAGICIDVPGLQLFQTSVVVLVDDLVFEGDPDYSIDFCREQTEFWNILHTEISQFTKLKGLFYLEDKKLNLSCGDFAEAYTGRHDWKDYTASFKFAPMTGEQNFANVRVKGAMRSYAAGFAPAGKLELRKNQNGYITLAAADFPWQHGAEYEVSVKCADNNLTVSVDGEKFIEYTDNDNPHLEGAIGLSCFEGSRISMSGISVTGA